MTDINSNRLPVNQKLLIQIFSKIKISPEYSYKGVLCWVWTAGLSPDGYPKVKYQQRTWRTQRLVYAMFVEIISDTLHGDHLCRNILCVNPVHIDPVTPKENLLRGDGACARNARKTHCKHGHPFSGDNLQFRKNGGRDCKTCRKEHSHNYHKTKTSDSRLLVLRCET